MPEWLAKLTKRIGSLASGRYCIILTVGKEADWTVRFLGKVEK